MAASPWQNRIRLLGEGLARVGALALVIVAVSSCGDFSPPRADRVFAAAAPSIFVVSVGNYGSDQPLQFGSGVAIADDIIVTNRHVVGAVHPSFSFVTVSKGERTWPAFPIHYSRSADLCTLVVPGLAAKPATFAPASTLKAGTPVFALGAPQGFELTITEGLVSAVRQLGGEEHLGMIQVSAPISPGSSGGGVFDRRGRLLGITTSFVAKAQGLSFAVPSQGVVEELRAIDYRYARAFAMALASAEAGDRAKAATLLQQAVQLQGDFSEGWLALGYLQNRPPASLDAFQKAASAGPNRPEPFLALGDALSSFASMTEGQVASGVLVGGAEVEAQIKALRIRAGSALETAVRLDDGNVEAWLSLGSLYDDLEDHPGAERAYRRALALAPNNLKAMTGLCTLYVYSSDDGAAVPHCSTVVKYAQLQPESRDRTYTLVQCWLGLSQALKRLGRTSDAEAAAAQWQLWQRHFLDEASKVGPDPSIARRRSARQERVRPLLPGLERRLEQ